MIDPDDLKQMPSDKVLETIEAMTADEALEAFKICLQNDAYLGELHALCGVAKQKSSAEYLDSYGAMSLRMMLHSKEEVARVKDETLKTFCEVLPLLLQ